MSLHLSPWRNAGDSLTATEISSLVPRVRKHTVTASTGAVGDLKASSSFQSEAPLLLFLIYAVEQLSLVPQLIHLHNSTTTTTTNWYTQNYDHDDL